MKPRILIADDDQQIIKTISTILKSENYETLVAFDGLQAINIAIKEIPDLILLDIRMPASLGTSVFEKLKASNKTATIPVIFVSAESDGEIKKKALDLGAEGYITKPFAAEYLISEIKRVLPNR
ncbi:MAG: response regulator [bacterium]